MKQIFNFANRNLCEYAGIFPDTATLMEHMFFVIGNGYEIDEETGVFRERGGKLVTKSPKMTARSWAKLIAECKEKERTFLADFYRGKPVDEVKLAGICEKYYPRQVDEYNFSEAHFYTSIKRVARERLESKCGTKFLRPYPLSEEYSAIFKLTENTPIWLVKIGYNLCMAWVRFLTEEIDKGHVAPDDKQRQSPSDGYATLRWTQTHRDMLSERLVVLRDILFAPGAEVRVTQRDPNWVYSGVAEPTEGLTGTIVEFKKSWHDTSNAGKVAIKFNPQDLGYLDDGENEPIIIFFRPQYLERL